MNREAERKRLVELLYGSKLIHNAFNNDEGLAHHLIMNLATNLIDNGIVVPPVKVGQTVYALVIEKIEEFVVVSVEFSRASGFSLMASNGIYPMLYNDKDIGKTVFTSREEALEKLKEGDGE